jgi:Contractile injection system tube protein
VTTPGKAQLSILDDNLDPAVTFDVEFNPTEYTLAKTVTVAEHPIPGLDAPVLQFVRGQSETLSVDLFFDSTDDGMSDGAMPVTSMTDRVYQLLKIDGKKHAPPICRFSWGPYGFPGSDFDEPWSGQIRDDFTCVVETIRQRFTLFSTEGVPLRAIVTLTLKEYKTLARQVEELNLQSADQTEVHVMRQDDTLSRIAADKYGDPAVWRYVAEANGIDDPLAVAPGTILNLPPVTA